MFVILILVKTKPSKCAQRFHHPPYLSVLGIITAVYWFVHYSGRNTYKTIQ